MKVFLLLTNASYDLFLLHELKFQVLGGDYYLNEDYLHVFELKFKLFALNLFFSEMLCRQVTQHLDTLPLPPPPLYLPPLPLPLSRIYTAFSIP